jgi:type 1 fimbria pilin
MRLIATATVLGLASVSAAAAGGGSAARFTFNPLGTYSTFLFDEGGCEIVSYDPSNQRLYVVNGGEERIDVLDTGAEGSLAFAFSIDISSYGPSIQSVAVKNGMVAAAIGAAVETDHPTAATSSPPTRGSPTTTTPSILPAASRSSTCRRRGVPPRWSSPSSRSIPR